MLIDSPRITPADRAHWERMEAIDDVYASRCRRRIETLAAGSSALIERFFADGSGYVGVSWGKDSVVLAALAQHTVPMIPIVWIRVRGVENPDCPLVRDRFLQLFPQARYEEIFSDPGSQRTSARGFALAARRHGDRYASGVRAEESRERALRIWSGLETARTVAPLGRWRAADIFATLYCRGLPVHPAYACSFGGTLDRARIRVGALGGARGTGRGRAEWERRYYGDDCAGRER